jgi:hypothetical protein
MTPPLSRPYACGRYRLRGLLAATSAVLALLVALPVAALQARDVPPPPADAEGLVRQASRNLDEYYLRPGATFRSYRRVLLAPVDVSFSRYWAREHRDVDAAESLKIRQDLAKLAREEFRRVLQRGAGYQLADAAGPDVLEVRASLVNLDITAPDVPDAAIRHNYVLSAGEATLVAELRDSQTGTLLARVVDRREMRRYTELQLATSVTNSAEAADLVATWSRLLRRQLDSAKSDSKGP